MATLESDSNMSTSQVKKNQTIFARDKKIDIVTNITVDGKGVLSDATPIQQDFKIGLEVL